VGVVVKGGQGREVDEGLLFCDFISISAYLSLS
jgi:hypothetical protein